ncbi:PepSY-associated TM helix domain-containing protein [Pseudomonas fluorescens]|uniref:PepSY domain-containing protein n=1 Tax=Pseudomonas fluorescens TaxID=294 RepID=A0A944HLT0_PSEFL|nr:PepSY domain-containing protein [Pseudomonas fluorescens]MBT2294068.1 PepSY domain-containing protein [Pseudomonas fluorescens]MBT2307275.1 PepSY domain-containing protein [Pseudomonas fluorescens]MBT2311208.1 PepSY domain-containing protein [Pseudomonas fluorescens]MBT2319737.1 PepSY domain-containing protein [Pseudomonas fluorescens]MBT2332098.1 PepSY domain-containing protein [Pseudomonas fluorescens]
MSKKSRSKLWFLVHSWLALPIWFFVLIVCVTGTLAVVSQEIVWLANPEMRASKPSDDAPLLSYDGVIAAIKQAQPHTQVQSIVRPDESHFALEVGVTYPDGRPDKVYVNPYSGAIQGSAPTFDFKAFTRALHGWWLVPFTNGFSWGWYLVSFLGLPLLASLVTGLVVYKRFWKGFFRPTLRIRHGARIFWGDFHRLSGIWSIWFIAVISITGTWFLIQALLSDNQISISSAPVIPVVARESVPLSDNGVAPPQLNLDRAIEIAQQRIPGLEASFVSLPGNAYSHMEIGGRGWYPLMFQTATLNPYNGEVAASRLLADRTALEFVTESMRPLHTGDFGGIWIKLIWFFFGLVLSMMVLSGLLIWTKRTALATANAFKRNQKPSREARTSALLQPSIHRESPEGNL